jgi:hypothetical protein
VKVQAGMSSSRTDMAAIARGFGAGSGKARAWQG